MTRAIRMPSSLKTHNTGFRRVARCLSGSQSAGGDFSARTEAADLRCTSGRASNHRCALHAAQAVFNAASELVKRKNQTVHPVRMTLDAALSNLNTRHAEFWANHH